MHTLVDEAAMARNMDIFGNEPSRQVRGKRVSTTVVEAKPEAQHDDLSAEQLEALDPRIREWVMNPNYTVVSQERAARERGSPVKRSVVDGRKGENTSNSSFSTALESGRGDMTRQSMPAGSVSVRPLSGLSYSEQVGKTVGRRSADGILTIKTGLEGKVDADEAVELKMLRRLGMHLPLRYKEEYKSFWPEHLPRTKVKRLEIEPLETYKLLQHYQMRLNRASLRTMEVQEAIYTKICGADFQIWSASHLLASTGVALNQLEVQISEAWNIENQLVRTRQKLGNAIQSLDRLYSALPPPLREFLGPMPFEVSPLFSASYYLKLNYWTLTPYAYETPELNALEIEWISHVLPYWDLKIHLPQTQALWRKGIPPRLRAFVWQKAIGNRLFLTRDHYIQHLAVSKESLLSDPIYSKVAIEQNNGSGPPAPDGTVEIDLSDPSQRTTDPVAFIIDSNPTLESNDTGAAAKISDPSVEGESQATEEISLDSPSLMADIPDLSAIDPNQGDESVISSELGAGESLKAPNVELEEKLVSALPEEMHLPDRKKKNYKELIIRDSLRTFSKLGIYRTPKTPPHDDLVAVLHAVATQRPELGYVQGQSFLAANMLLYMPAEEAFVALANLLEHHFFRSFCLFELDQIRLHTAAYEALLQRTLPLVAAHFKALHLAPELYVFDWYVTLFSKPLPPPSSGLIWDCYLLEGPHFIPLITCAILKPFASRLLQFNFDECMKLLQQLPDELNIAQVIADLDSFRI